MLLTEWNTEEAKEVWFEEGWEEGLERGREKGREEGLEVVVRNALEEGATLEFVRKITGLDMDAIRDIQARL